MTQTNPTDAAVTRGQRVLREAVTERMDALLQQGVSFEQAHDEVFGAGSYAALMASGETYWYLEGQREKEEAA